jgi:hypothetical protein
MDKKWKRSRNDIIIDSTTAKSCSLMCCRFVTLFNVLFVQSRDIQEMAVRLANPLDGEVAHLEMETMNPINR